jgi:hypothetical protein
MRDSIDKNGKAVLNWLVMVWFIVQSADKNPFCGELEA